MPRLRCKGRDRRVKNLYVILAIGPEAQVDPRGFVKALKRAQQRRVEITE